MREKILAILEQCKGRAGYYGITRLDLELRLTQYSYKAKHDYNNLMTLLQRMESEGLIYLTRSTSANDRGEITLICKR